MFQYFKAFWDWAEENPDKVNATNAAIYFHFLHIANFLRWKESFGVTAGQTMSALGIGSVKTYRKHFEELVESGLIQIVKRSTNQYSCHIIALPKITQPPTQADTDHMPEHLPSTYPSDDPIHKTIKDNKELKDIEDFNSEKKIKRPPKQKKNKEVLFRDSPYFDNPVLFMDEWSATKTAEQYPQIDPLALYESIKLTTDATDKYRYANWMAAAQNWAKRDPKQYFARTGIEQFSRGTQELHRRNETLSKLAFDPITGRPWDE